MTKKTALTIQYSASLVILFGLALTYIVIPQYIFTSAWLPLVLLALFIVMIVLGRRLGRKASREAGIDSVLIFRFFLLGFFVLWAAFPYVLGSYDVTEGDATITFFLILIVIANLIGIRIHLKSRASLVKNIKKEELFQ